MKRRAETIRVAMIPLIERQLVGEEEQIRYQPALPVRLKTGRFVLERYALLDTGSETCLIDRKIIEREVSADLAQRLVPLAAPGGTQYVPYYYFELDICGPNFETIRTLKQVSFAAVELPLGSDIVLGRQGVLENIKLTIDYPRHQIEIELPREELTTAKQPYLIEAESLISSGNYNAAVAVASATVERLLTDMAQHYGALLERRKKTFGALVKDLSRQKIVDKHLAAVLSEFTQLRNLAIHGLKSMTLSDAQHALALAEQAIISLEAKREEWRSSVVISAVTAFAETDMVIEYVDNLTNSTHERRQGLFVKAMEYKERGLYADAMDCLVKALDTDASGSEKIALLILLGTIYLKTSRIGEAKDFYERAIEEAYGVQDKFGLVAALSNLGIANKLAGNLMEAQMNMEKAIALCEELGFIKGKMNLLANLANVNIGLGRQEAARRYSQMAIGLVKTLEERSPDIREHSERVTDMAVKTANGLGLSGEEIDAIRQAALLHDIGMIAIPDQVLLKRGALTESEFTLIKSHAALSSKIIGGLEEFAKAIPIIRSHHERYDGSGYPEGLTGDNIPIGAQILGLADTYDALASERPYRRALTHEEALKELLRDSGRLWHPKVVEAFSKVML